MATQIISKGQEIKHKNGKVLKCYTISTVHLGGIILTYEYHFHDTVKSKYKTIKSDVLKEMLSKNWEII